MNDNAKVVPMVALRGLVVFPNTTITVDVGRPKSVKALDEALRQDGKLFFAAQKELTNIDPAKEEIFEIGTVCDVLQKIDLPNNNVRLLVKGLYRAKIVEYLKENDYFSVAVEELENKNSNTIVTQALLRQARELLATLCVNVPNKINKELLTKLADTYDPNQYADLICHLIIYQYKLKQKLLEIDDTQLRLEELCKIIANETEIAKVEKKISAQVKHHAADFKYAGLWKVYGDEQRARDLFAKYQRCTEIYCQRLHAGSSIAQLAVNVQQRNTAQNERMLPS